MIRKYLDSDYSEVAGLMYEFNHSSAVLSPVDSSHYDITLRLAIEGSPYVEVYVIECEGTVVGYVQLSLTHSNEAGGQIVWIDELYILPAYQGRGLGSSALQYVFSSHPQAKRFRLEVCKTNSGAIALYAKLGFVLLDYTQYVIDR